MSDEPVPVAPPLPNQKWGVQVPGEKPEFSRFIPCRDEGNARDLALSLGGGSYAMAYDGLPDPEPDAISEEQHEQNWLESIKEQAVEAGLVPANPFTGRPDPVYAADPAHENKSRLPSNSAEWREMMFRPGMAAAMMFVLYEVVHEAVAGGYESLDQLTEDLRAWRDLTIPQREAMTDLFVWVEDQVGSSMSVIPETVRANLARAFESYEAAATPEGDISPGAMEILDDLFEGDAS